MPPMVPQTARVRVAAPLRFLLAARYRHGDVAVPVDGVSSLVHVVESLGVPRTEIGELRIGGRSTPLSARPRAGEVIDVLPVPRPQPLAGRGSSSTCTWAGWPAGCAC